MRWIGLAVALAATAGCGGTTPTRNPTPMATVSVDSVTYTLDQLAPAPDDGSRPTLLYAVVRASTTGGERTLRESWFSLVDSSGRRYRPVPPSVYVPIDHFDGLVISAEHTGAGVVAFPVPGAKPHAIVIDDGGREGYLDAP